MTCLMMTYEHAYRLYKHVLAFTCKNCLNYFSATVHFIWSKFHLGFIDWNPGRPLCFYSIGKKDQNVWLDQWSTVQVCLLKLTLFLQTVRWTSSSSTATVTLMNTASFIYDICTRLTDLAWNSTTYYPVSRVRKGQAVLSSVSRFLASTFTYGFTRECLREDTSYRSHRPELGNSHENGCWNEWITQKWPAGCALSAETQRRESLIVVDN